MMAAIFRVPREDLAQVANANSDLAKAVTELVDLAEKLTDDKLKGQLNDQIDKLLETSERISSTVKSVVRANTAPEFAR